MPFSTKIPIPEFAAINVVRSQSSNVHTNPDPTAAPNTARNPRSDVVGAVLVYVFFNKPTLADGSTFVDAAVNVDPGVPAVVTRHSFNATAVLVVLKTPISRTRHSTEADPIRAHTGNVVDPAVVKPPAAKRDKTNS